MGFLGLLTIGWDLWEAILQPTVKTPLFLQILTKVCVYSLDYPRRKEYTSKNIHKRELILHVVEKNLWRNVRRYTDCSSQKKEQLLNPKERVRLPEHGKPVWPKWHKAICSRGDEKHVEVGPDSTAGSPRPSSSVRHLPAPHVPTCSSRTPTPPRGWGFLLGRVAGKTPCWGPPALGDSTGSLQTQWHRWRTYPWNSSCERHNKSSETSEITRLGGPQTKCQIFKKQVENSI